MRMRSDAVVLFGVTGDLVSKKLFPALYELTRRDRLDVPVIGVARSPWDDQQLVTMARKSVAEANDEVDDETFDRLADNLSMISGDYADPATYQRLAERLRGAERPVFYLAIPPAVFGAVVEGLAAVGLADRGRVIVEKPFGRDLESSRELDRDAGAAFDRSGCSASTTTSARKPSRASTPSGSPTGCSSRCGTTSTSTTFR